MGEGRDTLARRLLSAVQGPLRSPEAPLALVVAGASLSWSARRYDDAFVLLDALSARGPLPPEVLILHAELAGQLGWGPRQLAALRAAAQVDPAQRPRVRALLSTRRAWEDALETDARGVERAELLAALLRDEQARAEEATLDTRDARRGRLRLSLGLHRAAQALLEGEEAELAAFRAGDRVGFRTPWIQAAADFLEGRPDAGARLEALVQGGAPPEARLWRAEARFAEGDEEGALADIDAATAQRGEFTLTAALLRQHIEHRKAERSGIVAPAQTPEPLMGILAPGLLDLGFPMARLQTELASAAGTGALLSELHARLGAVRDPRASRSCRFEARRALELITLLPAAEVMRRLDALVAANPRDSMAIVHRGELHLWLGDTEAALADFRASLVPQRGTRWGFIGQIGALGLAGHTEEAVAMADREFEVLRSTGPSTHVYLGEAWLQAGETERAIEPLERAVALHPSRLGAQVSLALAAGRCGQRDRMEELVAGLSLQAEGMMACACAAEGVPLQQLWPDRDARGPAETRPALLLSVLARARVMMRGNRSSSCMTWFASSGELRATAKPSGKSSGMRTDRELQRAGEWLRQG